MLNGNGADSATAITYCRLEYGGTGITVANINTGTSLYWPVIANTTIANESGVGVSISSSIVTLQGVTVNTVAGTQGIYILNSSQVTLQGVTVDNVTGNSDGFGSGIRVDGGSAVTMQGTTVRNVLVNGVYVVGDNTNVTISGGVCSRRHCRRGYGWGRGCMCGTMRR